MIPFILFIISTVYSKVIAEYRYAGDFSFCNKKRVPHYPESNKQLLPQWRGEFIQNPLVIAPIIENREGPCSSLVEDSPIQ
jgi:hypothetical protein